MVLTADVPNIARYAGPGIVARARPAGRALKPGAGGPPPPGGGAVDLFCGKR